jgi:uncharacterized glyoxalase superfamily protein PhnB
VLGRVVRTNGYAGTRFVPILRYRDVMAAVDWLCGAFGFEKQDIGTAVDGTVSDARLIFGNDIILLLPMRGGERGMATFGKQSRTPVRSCYLVVDDVDLHYHRAKAAGAEILKVTDRDYGGRGYTCRDPEGHIWSFGTYDPWQSGIDHQPDYRRNGASKPRSRTTAVLRALRDNITPPVVIAAIVAAAIAIPVFGWILALSQHRPNAQMNEAFKRKSPLERNEEATGNVNAQPTKQPPSDRQPAH